MWLAIALLACDEKDDGDCQDCESDTDTDSDSDTDTDTDADTDVDTTDTGPPTDTTDTDVTTAPSWEVCASGAPFTEVQDAVDAAVDGDIIEICPGTYGAVRIEAKALELRGEDRATTILDGLSAAPALRVQGATVTVVGLTLTGASTQDDTVAGLSATAGADVTLVDSAVSGQRSGSADVWAIWQQDSTLTLDGVIVEDNRSSGLVWEAQGGTATLVHTVLRYNDTEGFVNFFESNVFMSNSIVHHNVTIQFGVPMRFLGESGDVLEVTNNTFAHNVMSDDAVSYDGNGVFENNLVVDNTGDGIAMFRGVIEYCGAWGQADNFYGPEGAGNLEEDPLFLDPAAGDFTLLAGFSPAIDAGNPFPQFNDADGSRNDMGAFGGPGGAWTPPP
jgi:hypothetical protein